MGAIHYCEGARLAQLEVEIALNTLLRRLPRLHLAVGVDELDWVETVDLRILRAMPVAF